MIVKICTQVPRFCGRENGIIPLNYKAQCNFLIISIKFLFYFDKLIGTFMEFTRLRGVTLYYSLIKKSNNLLNIIAFYVLVIHINIFYIETFVLEYQHRSFLSFV